MKIKNHLEKIINKILIGSAIVYAGYASAGDFSVNWNPKNNEINMNYEDGSKGKLIINQKEVNLNKRLNKQDCNCKSVDYNRKGDGSAFRVIKDNSYRFVIKGNNVYTIPATQNIIQLENGRWDFSNGKTSYYLNEGGKPITNFSKPNTTYSSSSTSSINELKLFNLPAIESVKAESKPATETIEEKLVELEKKEESSTSPVTITYISPYIHGFSEVDKNGYTNSGGFVGVITDNLFIATGGNTLQHKKLDNGRFYQSEGNLLANATPSTNFAINFSIKYQESKIPKRESSEVKEYSEVNSPIQNGTQLTRQTDESYVYEIQKETNTSISIDPKLELNNVVFKLNFVHEEGKNQSKYANTVTSTNYILQKTAEVQDGISIGTNSEQNILVDINSLTEAKIISNQDLGKATLQGKINSGDTSFYFGPVGGIINLSVKPEVTTNVGVNTTVNGTTRVSIPQFGIDENYTNYSTSSTNSITQNNTKNEMLGYLMGVETKINSPDLYLAAHATSFKLDTGKPYKNDWTPEGNASLLYNGKPILNIYGGKETLSSNAGIKLIQSGNFNKIKSSENQIFEASNSFNPNANEIIHKESLNQKANSKGFVIGYEMGIPRFSEEKNHTGLAGFYGDNFGINAKYSTLDEKVSGEVLVKAGDYIISLAGSRNKDKYNTVNVTLQ